MVLVNLVSKSLNANNKSFVIGVKNDNIHTKQYSGIVNLELKIKYIKPIQWVIQRLHPISGREYEVVVILPLVKNFDIVDLIDSITPLQSTMNTIIICNRINLSTNIF